MSIDVHGNSCIGVTHQVLQAFQVHASIGHIGAEGMPEHMGCDLRQRLIRMQLPILFQCPLEVMLNVHRHLGVTVLVQQQEPGIAINNPFLGNRLPSCNDVFQCFVGIVCHGDESAAAFGFRLLYIVSTIRLADKLVIHPDPTFLKIQLLLGQPAQFVDTHTRFQQHNKLVIVAGEMLILLDKGHEDIRLLLGQCNSLLGIVFDYI